MRTLKVKIPEQIAENRGKTVECRISVLVALLRHETARRRALGRGCGVWSRLFSFAVAAVLAAAAGYVAFRFAEIYTGLRESGRIVAEQRLSELLSAGIFLSVVLSLPTAAAGTASAFSDDGETAILAALPVRPSAIAAAKVLCAIPRQLACYAACLLVFSVAFGLAADKSAGDIVLCALSALTLFPVVPLAGVLAAPLLRGWSALKGRHAFLSAVLTLAVVGALFVAYAAGMGKMTEILSENNPHALFNAERTAALSGVLGNLYPAVFAARAAAGDGAAAGIAAAVGATGALLCGLFTAFVLPKTMKTGAECLLSEKNALTLSKPSPRRSFRRRARCDESFAPSGGCADEKNGRSLRRVARSDKSGGRTEFSALLQREVRAAVGTGRGFALFSPLVLAPLVAGALSHIVLGAATRMLTFDLSFPVAFTVGAVAAVFFGGAAASAVTADKAFFRVLGTLPVCPSRIAAAKVLLYGGVALSTGILSGAAAAVIAGIYGALAVEVAVAVGAVALSSSLFALTFDLSHPDMRRVFGDENGAAAVLGCAAGLAVCLLLGGSSAALAALSFSPDGEMCGWLSRVVPLCGALIVLTVAASACAFVGAGGVRGACLSAIAPSEDGAAKRRTHRFDTRKVFSGERARESGGMNEG